jgi:hypothetical protein
MFRWRGKLLMALIFYFAGFATAIYALAPAGSEGDQVRGFTQRAQASMNQIDTERLAQNAKAGLQKFVCFAEEKAIQAGELIKAKLTELNEVDSEEN